ncbi:nuclear transport factor 2 family protein [Kordiimonas laminariae]|uniref:nuclear transport factor 2 family protein n=1 Tax=Kordiimonas laminariae TaxID=2917717 RepID=UPI001FF4C704|nr:nuclear transport factor 2 family protein [Kordiimonas laminariae]MCK0068921.1 nuclear transport factor 2 family protein [Kordiimonas laminariae]
MADTAVFLEKWHKAVHDQDLELLSSIIADDASLLSPAFWRPREGKAKVVAVLKAVTETFEGLTYTKEWISGNEVILEFNTEVEGKNLKGIDRITLNDDGQLAEIEVLIRPMNGLMALAQALGPKLDGVA